MRSLMEWYNSDTFTPSIIKLALFVYEFLSIHPFQDGNGRLSRLLGSLLLLKHGYPWIQYVSFEHEVEQRKTEYYQVLMECQHGRPGENVTSWILFFLNCLGNIQSKLMQKLDVQKSENQMSPREKIIYGFIDNHPGSKSGAMAEKLKLPLPTVNRILSEMVNGNFLTKHGSGSGTNYTTETLTRIKKNIAMSFSASEKNKQFLLKNKHTFIQISRVILTPKFEWKKAEDWGRVLINHGLTLQINCFTNTGLNKVQTYSVSAFNNAYYYEPVFTLNHPIHIPGNVWKGLPNNNEYPINVVFKIRSKVPDWQFDVIFVYDAALE